MTRGDRRSASSGSDWERRFSYCRAVAVGDRAWVSGTTASSMGDDPAPDVEAQARRAFTIGLDALAELGFQRRHVVRTRMYLTNMADADVVGRVHGELFAGLTPASTMVGVDALIDPRLLVEVELEAASSGSVEDSSP